MAFDNRLKDKAWTPGVKGQAPTWDAAQIAILLDIRDQLYKLNGILQCENIQGLARILRRISKNTARPRQPKGATTTP